MRANPTLDQERHTDTTVEVEIPDTIETLVSPPPTTRRNTVRIVTVVAAVLLAAGLVAGWLLSRPAPSAYTEDWKDVVVEDVEPTGYTEDYKDMVAAEVRTSIYGIDGKDIER